MNATTARRSRATVHAAQPAAHPQPGWRQPTQEFLRSLSAPLEMVQKVAAADNLAAYDFLIPDIKRKVGAIFELTLSDKRPSDELADDVAEHFLHLETLLECAHDHREATPEVKDSCARLAAEVGKFYSAVLDSAVRSPEAASASCATAAGLPKHASAHVEWVFSQMSSLADTIGRLALDVLEDCDADHESSAQKCVGITALANQIGVLGEIGREDLGATGDRDIREWLLPPVYNERRRAA